MCLIINKPANVNFTHHELRNFWMRNSDGAGIMWATDQGVEVEKITRPTLDEWVAFYEQHAAGRACVIHLRMRTHGNINEENTHPYYVGRGYWLMHNGVLSTGNEKDRTKSDTWHFIRDSLRPALRVARRCLDNVEFLKKVGTIIGGSNRFAILGESGKVQLVNKKSGIMHKGAWFSNTYAWDAPVKRGKVTYASSWDWVGGGGDYTTQDSITGWDRAELEMAVQGKDPAPAPVIARVAYKPTERPMHDQRTKFPGLKLVKPGAEKASYYVRQMTLLTAGKQ